MSRRTRAWCSSAPVECCGRGEADQRAEDRGEERQPNERAVDGAKHPADLDALLSDAVRATAKTARTAFAVGWPCEACHKHATTLA
jgi:hypothetical protein